MSDSSSPAPPRPSPMQPFRRALLRGLGVLLPPLLTIVLFLWAGNLIASYVLLPLESTARSLIVWSIRDVRDGIPSSVGPAAKLSSPDGDRVLSFQMDGIVYVPLNHNKWIPQVVYDDVRRRPGKLSLDAASPQQYYERFVSNVYLRREVVLPVFFGCFIVVVYLLGKFLAAGVGRMTWNFFESLIHRLPIIRNVYSSVKQVTDFIFSEQPIDFNRVVAVEYPRRGTWSIGFVTGGGMEDVRAAANESILSVLMPTSPMPATGFTIMVRKSETIDLDITLDQAIQFIVSCGVVIPPHQQRRVEDITARINQAIARRQDSLTADTASNVSSQGAPSQGEAGHEEPPESAAPSANGRLATTNGKSREPTNLESTNVESTNPAPTDPAPLSDPGHDS